MICQGETLTTNRSNTLECQTRLSTRLASPREVSKETSAADEEDSQEAITVDEAVTADAAVVVVEAVDEDEVNKIATMPWTIPSMHSQKWLCITPVTEERLISKKGNLSLDIVPTPQVLTRGILP